MYSRHFRRTCSNALMLHVNVCNNVHHYYSSITDTYMTSLYVLIYEHGTSKIVYLDSYIQCTTTLVMLDHSCIRLVKTVCMIDIDTSINITD